MASDTPRQILAEASGLHAGCRREDNCKEGRGGYRRMSRVESRMVGSALWWAGRNVNMQVRLLAANQLLARACYKAVSIGTSQSVLLEIYISILLPLCY